MIITSNLSTNQKTYAVICKLVLYLTFWFHLVACGWWTTLTQNSGRQFYKKQYGIQGFTDCVYADDIVVLNNADVFNPREIKEKNLKPTDPFKCDDNLDSMWLDGKTFAVDDWKRYTDIDRPFGYAWFTAGALPWNEMNTFWEETPKGWIAPMNMANWTDQDIYSNKHDIYYRY